MCQAESPDMGGIYKKGDSGKDCVDTNNIWTYHVDMRSLIDILNRFVNNVAQPGNLLRRKNK